jgi:ribosomal-protein-alanine N-acetyltransferase
MIVLETERLTVRWFNQDDAAFVLKLLNDPAFLHFIGDKEVHDLAGARAHIENKLVRSYTDNGYGMNMVQLTEDHTPIGMCGLINRDELEYVDIGYAFLPEFCGRGYAYEAAKAVFNHGKNNLKIDPIVAITAMDNIQSANLLEKLGLKKQKTIKMNENDTGTYFYC